MLALWGVLAPGWGWAQTAPARFDVSPSSVEQGECYTISVGTPNITLDVKYRFNNGPSITLTGWPSIGSNGTARICTSSSTAPGAYTFVEARNTLGGAWVSGGDTLRVTAPPPPDFTITARPGSRTVGPTGSATYTVSVSPRNGFNSTVNLSASSLGSNVTAAFSRSALSSPYTSTSTLTLTANGASAGTDSVTITGTGGGLSRTDSVDLRVVVPQPTSFSITPDEGYAGAHTVRATAGNGAGMSLNLRYTINGKPKTGTIPLDANGQWSYTSTRDDVVGTYHYTEMKNALASAWVTIDETYIVRPPQPTTMSISPSSFTLPGEYTMTVGNGAGMTLDVRYTLTPPGGTTGPVQTIEGWPVLTAAGGDNGTADIPAGVDTPPGVYRYTAMRNTLNTAWVNVNAAVTVRSPPPPDFTITATPESRTVESGGSATEATYTVSVSPANGFNSTVNLSASGLPSGVMADFDPAVLSSPYTGSSTLTLTVAARAPAGTAEVTITGTGGGLSRTDSVDLVVVPQPTSFSITPDEGYAGAHTVRATVGNGAGMSLDLRYAINGAPREGTIPLDANGQWSYTSTRDDVVGTYVYTEMKNALASAWVTIDETYKVLPPRPTSGTMSLSESSISPPGSYTMRVGNGAGMTLDVRYTHTPPGGTAGPVTTMENWPVLMAVGDGSTDGTAEITINACKAPGLYSYTGMRNTLHEREQDWVAAAADLTVNSPVSVMSVAPTSIVAGTSATVTLTGQYLCDLSLSTTYPGVTISDVTFDAATVAGPNAGTTATALITVASTAAAGTATVTVDGGQGSTTFDLILGPAPSFTIDTTTARVYAPPTGRAPYTVSVVPVSGFDQDVALSVSGLPSGVMAAFDPSSLSAPYDATSTLTLTTDGASVGTDSVTITGTGGGLSPTTTVELVVVPQPTTYQMSPEEGYAGAHTVRATVGNGAGMTLDVRYTINGEPRTGTIPLDANGQWSYTSTRDDVVGTYHYTEMKNALLPEDSAWVTIDETYKVLPPRPTSGTMSLSESSISPPGSYTMRVGNGAGMTLDVRYTHTPPGGTAGPVTTMENWPVLMAVGDGSTDGTAEITINACKAPGLYSYTGMRNTLHEREQDWVAAAADLTVNSPVSVTSVEPSSIVAGTSATVTLTGQYLCDLSLSTTYTGVTISDVTFDAATVAGPNAGTTATALITVASTAAAGTATVTVDGGQGSTTFDLILGQPPSFTLTASPAAEYAAPTGRAAYTVKVVPVDGFDQDVQLSVDTTQLPANVEASFDRSTLSAPYTRPSTLTLTTTGASLGATSLTLTGAGGALSRTVPVELTVVAQPTTFVLATSEGYAGIDSISMTVGNGANMSLDLAYTLNGRPQTGTIPLDANGQSTLALPHEIWTGVFVYTGMKNALLPEDSPWVTINNVTYTVRPPQPTTMSLTPPTLTPPGSYTMRVGNGANQTLDAQYTLTPPGGTAGDTLTLYGWPELLPAGEGSTDGTAVIEATGCTPPGLYQFTAMRNTRNTAWKDLMPPVPITIDSPVSVTEVAPAGGLPPGSGGSGIVDVTITGEHLCGLTLTTTYTGLTISNVVSDAAAGAGTVATATFTIAAGTLPGIAEIQLTGAGGSTTFSFTIGTPTSRLILSAVATEVSEDPDAQPIAGAPANAGQSVAVTATVTPAPISGTRYSGCNIRAAATGNTADAADYHIPTRGRAIRAVESWAETFTFWVLDDTEAEEEETLVLEAFCTGAAPNAPPPVAPADLPTVPLIFTISDNDAGSTMYYKREYIYLGGRVIAVESP